MKYLILFISLLIMSNDYETQKYKVIFQEDNFEIRYYEPAIKAKVSSENGSNKNFMKLFRYISGNNSKNEKISMTTPVYVSNENSIEFVMPAKFNIENISKPNDENIKIYQSKAGYYASLRFGGYGNQNKIKNYSTILFEKLKSLNIKYINNPYFVSYNSPYKIFNRRNEVMIKIEYKK